MPDGCWPPAGRTSRGPNLPPAIPCVAGRPEGRWWPRGSRALFAWLTSGQRSLVVDPEDEAVLALIERSYPFTFPDAEGPIHCGPAPILGQHDRGVLGGIVGLAHHEIADLEQRGICCDQVVAR